MRGEGIYCKGEVYTVRGGYIQYSWHGSLYCVGVYTLQGKYILCEEGIYSGEQVFTCEGGIYSRG